MNQFFSRMPLRVKLLIIAIIPMIFIIYLSSQVYNEKLKNIALIRGYLNRMEQSATISRLIDNLQKERTFSFDYAMLQQRHSEMMRQRTQTDSLISVLKQARELEFKNFTTYTFLKDIDSIRLQIDRNEYNPGQVINFFSSSIFRLTTLHSTPSLNDEFLEEAYNEMISQRLFSEMGTYLGIITANFYNLLYTKSYVIGTLAGTQGTYNVYNTYKEEIREKAAPSILKAFDQLMASPSMIAVDNYLAQTFSKYSFDSTYSYVTWHKISGEALSDLRSLQMNLLQKVESSVQYYYEEEQLAKSRTLVFLVLSIILLFSLVFFILALINRSLKQIQKAALKIAGGATDIKLHHNSNDAIGSLATSIRKIDDQNRRLTLAAGNIGRGDFNTPLHLRSNEDLLSNAILQMRDNLKTFTNDLQMSREEFRKLADFMPQIVWTAMPDGTTDYLNAKWYEITGDRTENITNGWMHVLHPDDLGKSLNLWLKAVEQEKDYEIEYRFLDVRSNTYRWFLGRSVPVRDAEGNVVKWFGTCTDIHDQKMQEEILENTIATRTRELQRSNEDLQQFAHVASHDLKEPLRKIRTFGDMLQMEFGNLLPERARVYISKIQFSSERMSNMIEGVLKYSVMNASEKDLEIIQPALVLDGIKNDLELLMIQKDAKIIYGRLPKLKVIPALIYQLFYNLLNNALKFSKPDVPVEINITAKEVVSTAAHAWLDLPEGKAFICLEFADNGIGFNPDYAQKMFNVFTRLNPMHQYEGTGLGLALCKKIVQRHGGAIYAEGNEGAGASFFVLLPKE